MRMEIEYRDYGAIGGATAPLVPIDTERYSQVFWATHDDDKKRLSHRERSFISFSFGGKYIEDFDLLAIIENNAMQKDLYAGFGDNTTESEVWDGQIYWSTHMKTNTITFRLFTDGIEEKVLGDFKQWFRPGRVEELILEEHPNRTILARVSSPPVMSMLPFEGKLKKMLGGVECEVSTTLYKGAITLTLVTDEPYWRSRVNLLDCKDNLGEYETGYWYDANDEFKFIMTDKDATKIIVEDGVPSVRMIGESNAAITTIPWDAEIQNYTQFDSLITYIGGRQRLYFGFYTQHPLNKFQLILYSGTPLYYYRYNETTISANIYYYVNNTSTTLGMNNVNPNYNALTAWQQIQSNSIQNNLYENIITFNFPIKGDSYLGVEITLTGDIISMASSVDIRALPAADNGALKIGNDTNDGIDFNAKPVLHEYPFTFRVVGEKTISTSSFSLNFGIPNEGVITTSKDESRGYQGSRAGDASSQISYDNTDPDFNNYTENQTKGAMTVQNNKGAHTAFRFIANKSDQGISLGNSGEIGYFYYPGTAPCKPKISFSCNPTTSGFFQNIRHNNYGPHSTFESSPFQFTFNYPQERKDVSILKFNLPILYLAYNNFLEIFYSSDAISNQNKILADEIIRNAVNHYYLRQKIQEQLNMLDATGLEQIHRLVWENVLMFIYNHYEIDLKTGNIIVKYTDSSGNSIPGLSDEKAGNMLLSNDFIMDERCYFNSEGLITENECYKVTCNVPITNFKMEYDYLYY